jgi:hypothetical protein
MHAYIMYIHACVHTYTYGYTQEHKVRPDAVDHQAEEGEERHRVKASPDAVDNQVIEGLQHAEKNR